MRAASADTLITVLLDPEQRTLQNMPLLLTQGGCEIINPCCFQPLRFCDKFLWSNRKPTQMPMWATRDWTSIPCTGRWRLKYWTARKPVWNNMPRLCFGRRRNIFFLINHCGRKWRVFYSTMYHIHSTASEMFLILILNELSEIFPVCHYLAA